MGLLGTNTSAPSALFSGYILLSGVARYLVLISLVTPGIATVIGIGIGIVIGTAIAVMLTQALTGRGQPLVNIFMIETCTPSRIKVVGSVNCTHSYREAFRIVVSRYRSIEVGIEL